MIIPLDKIIAPEAVEAIRETAAAAELQGSLHQAQLELAWRNNWFNLFVPKANGGLELSLPEALRVEEALAWADGSLGWTVTLCSGANFFIGFLHPDEVQDIFSNPKVCLAGSGAPTGTANLRNGMYEITGRWKYATGAPHATIFTVACIIKEDGVIKRDSNGNPVAEAFWLKPSEVKQIHDWHMMGMKATGSISFEAGPILVPQSRRFLIEAAHAVMPHAVFRYPFHQFAETTLGINFCGMAFRFLEILLLQHSTSPAKMEVARKHEAALLMARDLFYAQVERSWDMLVKDGRISEDTLTEVSIRSINLFAVSKQLMQELYPVLGMQAADANTEANRIWRNFFTASQHKLLRGL